MVDKVLNRSSWSRCSTTPCAACAPRPRVWCHTCWGNPAAQRLFAQSASYKAAIEPLSRIDADVITFETCSSAGMDLEAIGRNQGQEDLHRRGRPPHAAGRDAGAGRGLVRKALEHIPAERLILGPIAAWAARA
jgi:5-methyltetrahydropteroyltriglutamate--homocysteine methyltransferase